jgi:hypothetical protein
MGLCSQPVFTLVSLIILPPFSLVGLPLRQLGPETERDEEADEGVEDAAAEDVQGQVERQVRVPRLWWAEGDGGASSSWS